MFLRCRCAFLGWDGAWLYGGWLEGGGMDLCGFDEQKCRMESNWGMKGRALQGSRKKQQLTMIARICR